MIDTHIDDHAAVSTSNKILRQFAGLCLLIFGGLAAWEYVGRDHQRLALLFGGLRGPGLAARHPAHLRDGYGPHHADRLGDIAPPPGSFVLWTLHPCRTCLQADWPRRPRSPVCTRGGELLGAQAGPHRHP
jgi:hypothetical protein